MNDAHARFIDASGPQSRSPELWPAIVIPKEDLDAEVARLADAPASPNGRRSALIVHPCAQEPGLGLAPGIRVALDVLRPSERTQPIRHNSTAVGFCIRGRGVALLGTHGYSFEQHDVWNVPAMMDHSYINDGDDLCVRLTYSNAPLLEKMHVHIVDESPPSATAVDAGPSMAPAEPATVPETLRLTTEGAYLMPYEQLINPPTVESKALHWPWQQVKHHLDRLDALGSTYVGRRLYLLYNPATGRTNGTTPSFFATMTIRPPGIVDRPHRHTSAAINYYFAGHGWSTVEGRRLEWKAGDLMLSAPGWGVHHHASADEPVYELTVQDSPLNIAMESLLWQEDLQHPPAVLGIQAGFATNRPEASA